MFVKKNCFFASFQLFLHRKKEKKNWTDVTTTDKNGFVFSSIVINSNTCNNAFLEQDGMLYVFTK